MENITFGLLALANVLVPNAMAMTASDSVGTSATPVYSTIQVVAAATTTTNDTDADVSIVAPVESSISVGTTTGMSATELYVRNAFKSTPVLIQVARCESQFRQTDSDGNILHGTVDPRDVGVMQINEHYQGVKRQLSASISTPFRGTWHMPRSSMRRKVPSLGPPPRNAGARVMLAAMPTNRSSKSSIEKASPQGRLFLCLNQ